MSIFFALHHCALIYALVYIVGRSRRTGNEVSVNRDAYKNTAQKHKVLYIYIYSTIQRREKMEDV